VHPTFIYDESWDPFSGNLIAVWSPKGRLWSSGWEAHQIKYEPLPRSVIREPNTLYEGNRGGFSCSSVFCLGISPISFSFEISTVCLCYDTVMVLGVEFMLDTESLNLTFFWLRWCGFESVPWISLCGSKHLLYTQTYRGQTSRSSVSLFVLGYVPLP
jgi:hypothetical protein